MARTSAAPKKPKSCGTGGSSSHGSSSKIKKSRSSRWRLIVLLLVHVAFALHLAHWASSGETLSPLEPSESMETLRTGMINAGFIFFGLAILSTLIFGRFFCGWACHVVALQDVCAWMLRKVGIRPKMFRTRTLIAVPFIVGFYMFLYPTVYSWIDGWLANVAPQFQAAWGRSPDIEEWQLHVTKAEFWETFPTVGIGLFTLFVAGFAVVYFLGAKGFCNYGCPYGAFFAVADRFAPGKIVANLDACEGCGHCTATCTSNVAVHKEIQVYEKVVDRGCMKCLDCVSVCPNGALSFSMTKPQLLTKALPEKTKPKKTYDVSWGGELALWGMALLVFFSMRGVYGLFPLLLSLGLAGSFSFVFWKAWRLLRDRQVSFHGRPLRHAGSIKPAGVAWLAAAAICLAVTFHSAWMQTVQFRAKDTVQQISMELGLGKSPGDVRPSIDRALADHRTLQGLWHGGAGLLHNPEVDLQIAWLSVLAGDRETAGRHLDRAVGTFRPRESTVLEAARLYSQLGEPLTAENLLRDAWEEHPTYIRILAELRGVLAATGRLDEAKRLYEEYLADKPDASSVRLDYGMYILGPIGQVDAARAEIEKAEKEVLEVIEERPQRSGLRATLANSVYLPMRRYDEAKAQYKTALEHKPDSPDLRNDYAVCLMLSGDPDGALTEFERYAELAPKSTEPPQRLAVVNQQLGRTDEAQRWQAEYDRRVEQRRRQFDETRWVRWLRWFVDHA